MSTERGNNTQTTQISNQFDTDVSEEDAKRYTNLDSKSENIRFIIGFILTIPLFIVILDIIIPFIPIDGFLLIAILIVFIGVIFMEILLKPLQNEMNSVGVSRDSVARFEFDKAIDQYNNGNYKRVINILSELRAVRGSNIDAITNHSKQLEQYIRKLEKRDEDEQKQYIKEDFPAIADAIVAEYESRRRSHDVVSTSTDRIEIDRNDKTEISLSEIYIEFLSEKITKERVGLLVLGGIISIGLYYLIFVSTGIGSGLIGIGTILFALLKHYEWL